MIGKGTPRADCDYSSQVILWRGGGENTDAHERSSPPKGSKENENRRGEEDGDELIRQEKKKSCSFSLPLSAGLYMGRRREKTGGQREIFMKDDIPERERTKMAGEEHSPNVAGH